MSQAGIIPTIGTKGTYTALTPYNTLILTNVNYTLVGIRTLQDIILGGDDPQALYYTPQGLDAATYASDVAAGAVILTIMAPDDSLVSLPSTYLSSYPNGNGYPYTVMAIGLNLGAISDALDLSALTEKLTSDCLNMLGVVANAQVVALSNQELVNASDHAAIETARTAKITNNTTDYAALVALQTENARLLTRVTQLEAYILAQSKKATT